ncbi:hypothetical protein SAMN05421504_1021185 [Amycolatopsis xylanica]|uniref:DUF485 domain-containing protein n=1 Tax=Amycolatopsis xylanica TaxID=589385 RepID=A0A1H3B5Y6_9PSEU|nr:hypothetical protein [Amycolatopsis xylanica]SDX37041.1 hypothetical protein SAMN05421504_1021185 [Amycolatopsis xylanica]
MTSEDYYRRVNGVREPDPTLGKKANLTPERAVVEPVAAAPTEPMPQPELPKIKRTRVILADPRQSAGTLRARVELEEQTSWGELLIKDLVKAQLKTGMLLWGLVIVLLGSLPALFYFLPGFGRVTLIGVPLPWLLLGVAPFPLLFGVGIWYNRLAERHERDFVDMIEN